MYLFYAVMILLGVAFVILSIFMLMMDRRRAQEISNNLDTKKEDIIEVINDAEQIVIEMNNFSDYLFEKIDEKAQEIHKIMELAQKKVEEKIGQEKAVESMDEVFELGEQKVVNGSSVTVYSNPIPVSKQQGNPLKKSPKVDVKVEGTQIDLSEILNPGREKVIPINPKHRNVFTLLEKGYSEIEIAKTLHIGLGEIKLILGVKR